MNDTSKGIDGVFRNAIFHVGLDVIGIWFEDITEGVRSERALSNRVAEIEAL